MKLNIYEGKKIAKTYEADTYDLMFGVLEDVADAVKLDEMKTGSNEELVKMALGFVTRSIGTVRDMMKDIFEGITDEELRHTRVSEMGAVIVEIIKYTISQLNRGISGKN